MKHMVAMAGFEAFLIAFLSLSAVRANPLQCPSYEMGAPLTMVTLFDGPPADAAILEPDASQGSMEHDKASWQVGYIFDNNRSLFLVCQYANTPNTVTIKADTKLQQCTFRTFGLDKPADMICR